MSNVRTETDTFGPIEVAADRYWGAQAQRSLGNCRDAPAAGCHCPGFELVGWDQDAPVLDSAGTRSGSASCCKAGGGECLFLSAWRGAPGSRVHRPESGGGGEVLPARRPRRALSAKHRDRGRRTDRASLGAQPAFHGLGFFLDDPLDRRRQLLEARAATELRVSLGHWRQVAVQTHAPVQHGLHVVGVVDGRNFHHVLVGRLVVQHDLSVAHAFAHPLERCGMRRPEGRGQWHVVRRERRVHQPIPDRRTFRIRLGSLLVVVPVERPGGDWGEHDNPLLGKCTRLVREFTLSYFEG
ncbi:MAG: hypothetical protein EON92_16225 [Burkholderiales bacterium]|nr:MAG: hypothetical protein EON92_16225 [Burkholderiales bacterium]